MVGMPMPKIKHTNMVSNKLRNRLVSPTLMIAFAKVVAAPVSVSTPMITPTKAQATPTGSA